MSFTFLLSKLLLKSASYFIVQTFWRFYVDSLHLDLTNKEDNCLHIR